MDMDMDIDKELEVDVVKCEDTNISSATLLKQRLTINGLSNHFPSKPADNMPIVINEVNGTKRNILYNMLVIGKLKENQQRLEQDYAKMMKPNLKRFSNEKNQKLNDLIVDRNMVLKKPRFEHNVKRQDHRIIAVIDLDDNEESLPSSKNASDTNNSDVDIEDNTFSLQHNNIKSAEHSKGNEVRVVASLNLVSSDSETGQENENLSSSTLTSPVKTQKRRSHRIHTYKQHQHQQKATDTAESFKPNETKSSLVKCPVCEIEFAVIRRLLCHMRCKHRDYNGAVLVEKPRLSQDSSMTIRLRYMRRITYYECQLCGHIDDVYKEHKNHILDKHPVESKCLRDPFVKQLKCPICKTECGSKYLNLCRHILNKHERQQYKSYLKQISSIAGNSGSKKSIQTAIIYQYTKFKTMYFECKLCHKVVDGYQHHLRHLKKHKDTLTAIRINKSKPVKKLASVPQTTRNSKDSTKRTKAKTKTKTSATAPVKAKEKQTAGVLAGKVNNKKRYSQSKEANAVSNLKIVKAKPPLKQISVQTYECRICCKAFIGFCTFNLHLLKQHAHNEFSNCKLCGKAFLTRSASQKHEADCERSTIDKFKTKRKSNAHYEHHLN